MIWNINDKTLGISEVNEQFYWKGKARRRFFIEIREKSKTRQFVSQVWLDKSESVPPGFIAKNSEIGQRNRKSWQTRKIKTLKQWINGNKSWEDQGVS